VLDRRLATTTARSSDTSSSGGRGERLGLGEQVVSAVDVAPIEATPVSHAVASANRVHHTAWRIYIWPVRCRQDKSRMTVSDRTLAHYQANAEAFWEGTKDHDVTQNYTALLGHLEGRPPFAILDFGCGPGRDLAYFRSLGHEAVGLDGCAAFCAMARSLSGCDVLHQDFMTLALPAARFDGVFANASLFHVPGVELPRVLGELRAALKPRGVLFSSNPRGGDREGWSGERYGCYWELDRYRAIVTAAGYREITHYYRPSGKPREEQPWLATVWRRED
jgi:SAM-dependent methyltransferase